MAYYTYILECSDGTLYTGVTGNLDKRVEEHALGKYSNCYTYRRRPIKLVYYQEFEWIYHAIDHEKKFKKWTNAKKRAYIAGDFDLLRKLSRSKKKKQSEEDPPTSSPSI